MKKFIPDHKYISNNMQTYTLLVGKRGIRIATLKPVSFRYTFVHMTYPGKLEAKFFDRYDDNKYLHFNHLIPAQWGVRKMERDYDLHVNNADYGFNGNIYDNGLVFDMDRPNLIMPHYKKPNANPINAEQFANVFKELKQD